MRFQFLQGALRHSKKLHKRSAMFATMALGDICRHRHSRSTNLACHPINLFLREARRQTVSPFGDHHGFLPDLQVTVRTDLYSRALLFAIRYSLFATSLLIARQHRIIRTLPWREKIEVAEFLIEADRLIEHALLLVVV